MPSQRPVKIAMIGYGEAGRALTEGWRDAAINCVVSAYDVDPARTHVATRASALADASVVFCLVTADQAGAALSQICDDLADGALVFDGNSCAPATKRGNARLISAAGGRYVDMAIMAPVCPKRHETPMLISGPHVVAANACLGELGMSSEVIDGEVGRASTIKMVRSIMVKGLEGLMCECILAARRAGVDEIVLRSLEKSYPGFGWSHRAAYNLERMLVHGKRRAAEMREVEKTVVDLGVNAGITRAVTDWQQTLGDLSMPPGDDDYRARADAIIAALSETNTKL